MSSSLRNFRFNRFLGVFTFAVCLTSPAGAADTPPSKDATVIVRTEKDIEQGKKNVRAVVDELAFMLENPQRNPIYSIQKRQVAPAYCKVIKGNDDRATLIYRPRYTPVKDIFKAIDGIVSGNTYLEPLSEQNMIILNTSEKSVENYRNILNAIDIPMPMVLIEAKVVEVLFNDGMQRNFSFSWNNNNGGISTSAITPGQTSQPENGLGTSWDFSSGSNKFKVSFQWLLTAQDAKVISSPNILLTRNAISRIVTGSDIPIQETNATSSTTSFTTTFKRVGVELEVEPQTINSDSVTMRIYPKVSNVSSYETVSTGLEGGVYSVPVISIRSVETYLKMYDGQMVMMGGLYSSSNALQQQRVPFLSDVPWLGEFFTGKNYTKEVTQLIFFLKVHVIPPDEVYSSILFDPEANAELSENLGELMKSGDAMPVHPRTTKSLGDELVNALPGQERRNRAKFRAKIDEEINKSQKNESQTKVEVKK